MDDLKDELFDMAKTSLPHCVQLEDLIKCGVGDTIVKILIDSKGFYDYDQRETGGITEEEFEEMDISGYTNNPSPPPLEHPNSARSKGGSETKDTSGSGSPGKEEEKKDKSPDDK